MVKCHSIAEYTAEMGELAILHHQCWAQAVDVQMACLNCLSRSAIHSFFEIIVEP